MKAHLALLALTLAGCALSLGAHKISAVEEHPWTEPGQDWANYVRIGAYGLRGGDAQRIVHDAEASGVFGIEVDNDIPGRYESFVHPEAKLKAIRDVAEEAHRAGNYAFVYIAGTECITAHADQTAHTLAKEHPDWLQRDITGKPAIFGGGQAFWIAAGDEDVWVTPYAPEWRKTYMGRVRQIAATGIDGIYVDIPYWMTHFDGWENTWASFDDYTLAAFRQQTGLDAKHDLKLGDFSDPAFRKWVEFRIQTFTDFMHEIDTTAKAVNPKIKTIPEIYPGIEEEAVRVGADVYSLYGVVDAIAHEYEFGSGDHMASDRTPLDWFRYQVGMHSFRAFAQNSGRDKPTWILNYSWDGDRKKGDNAEATIRESMIRESMMNLAMSQVMAGANFWDAPGHSMAGSNDIATRKKIFAWIKDHEKTFYAPRAAIDPIGVYFSPQTRNYYAEDFIASYRGILILLMQKHLEFQIVTPRTLGEFKGKTLVLPDVRVLGAEEKNWLKNFVAQRNRLIVTGADATEIRDSKNVTRMADDPGKAYNAALEKDFEHASPELERAFFEALPGSGAVKIKAGPLVATSIARTDGGQIHCFFANFSGLQGGSNPVQTPEAGVEVSVKSEAGGQGFFLPFLGEVQIFGGVRHGHELTFALPAITKGAVFWYEPYQYKL
jgi:hypothetical protein